jgi:DNA-binding NarL/FixJ family response regulator
MIRVLLIDDHTSFRELFAFRLERDPDLSVVGQAGSLAEARTMVGGVHVALVDLHLPDGDGVDLIRDLRTGSPNGAVLVLTASEDPGEVARAVEAGAAGILHKSAGLEEITGAMRRLSAGELLMSPREAMEMMRLASGQRERDRGARAALTSLTPREREVLQVLARGLGDREIAEQLGINWQTAQKHVANVLGKLGVDSRLQAVVFAVHHGTVRID